MLGIAWKIKPALNRQILSGVTGVLFGLVWQAAAGGFCLYPTGVDDDFSLLSGGSADPHYILIKEDGSESAAIVLTDVNCWHEWVRPGDARWLYNADASDSGLRGWVTFETTFALCSNEVSTAQLSGLWAADQYGWIGLNGAATVASLLDGSWYGLNSFKISSGFIPGLNTLQFHVAMPDGGDGLVVSRLELTTLARPRLSISFAPESGVSLGCDRTQFTAFSLLKSYDLVNWAHTGINLGPGYDRVVWGSPEESRLFFRLELDESLTLSAPAADATTVQLRWPPMVKATEYRVFRNGTNIGNTAGRTGYYLDSGLTPVTAYEYYVTAYDENGHLLGASARATFSTAASTRVRTQYKVLVMGYYPNGPEQGEFSHVKTYLRHRLDFIRHASLNSAILQPYKGDVVCIRAFTPQIVGGYFNVDYVRLVTTPYPELDGYSIVDLVEKGDVDVVWVVAASEGCNFYENALVGNRDLNPNPTGEKWSPAPAKCSRVFFVNDYSADARSYDAYVHMVEGILTTMSDGYPTNWPRDYPYEVYSPTRADFTTTYTANLRLFERFRLADAWNGGTYASKGNGNCGSSHFPPNARRDTDEHYDGNYAYYDLKTWQRYIDCAADDWLHYPSLTGATRKLNGYDFGGFNNYVEGEASYAPAFRASPELHPSFRFGTDSYHFWWFFHLPHNPGVANGKLNNWWPYLFDFNRFDGSTITFPVEGFPEFPSVFPPVNAEYGTEVMSPELWGYWHSCCDFGPYGRVVAVGREQMPGFVRQGRYALEITVDQESFQSDGRNDAIFPISRNAGWDLSRAQAVSFALKLDLAENQVRGVNPVLRLCANGGNRIELVPLKDGAYADFLRDNRFLQDQGWHVFRIPLDGSQDWEVNVIGYLDLSLGPGAIAEARQELKRRILGQVNWVEVSVRSEGGRGSVLRYYLDDLELMGK